MHEQHLAQILTNKRNLAIPIMTITSSDTDGCSSKSFSECTGVCVYICYMYVCGDVHCACVCMRVTVCMCTSMSAYVFVQVCECWVNK